MKKRPSIVKKDRKQLVNEIRLRGDAYNDMLAMLLCVLIGNQDLKVFISNEIAEKCRKDFYGYHTEVQPAPDGSGFYIAAVKAVEVAQ